MSMYGCGGRKKKKEKRKKNMCNGQGEKKKKKKRRGVRGHLKHQHHNWTESAIDITSKKKRKKKQTKNETSPRQSLIQHSNNTTHIFPSIFSMQ